MPNGYKTDIVKLLRELERQGWTVIQRKHYICRPPDKSKPQVTMSVTPSDKRALENIKHQLRKSGANI